MDYMFRQSLMDGHAIICPYCDRMARRAKLRIHSTIAHMLCRLHKAAMISTTDPEGWVHLDVFKPVSTSGNDFSIVKHWGLAQSKPPDNTEKNSSGMWRLRPRGVSFVEGRESIEKYLWTFDDMVLEASPERMDIHEALGKKFNYAELFA